jgi:hypothetical protein
MLVLATTGRFIMVMAVVVTDKVIVQPPTDYIYSGRQMDDDDSHDMRIAKVLYRIGRCIDELSKYYVTVSPASMKPNSEHPRFFPSITSYYHELTSSIRSFRYVRSPFMRDLPCARRALLALTSSSILFNGMGLSPLWNDGYGVDRW